MEAGGPGRQAGSFSETGIRLILYAKNCLGKRAHKPECAYIIPVWHVSQGILEGIPLFTNTDIASDSRMSSPLTRLPWFDDII